MRCLVRCCSATCASRKIKELTAGRLYGRQLSPSEAVVRSVSFDHCFSSVQPISAAALAARRDPPNQAPVRQDRVYATIGQQLLNNALHGFNGCVFAYDQTGSGKTHTVLGHERDPGSNQWSITRHSDQRTTIVLWSSRSTLDQASTSTKLHRQALFATSSPTKVGPLLLTHLSFSMP